MRTAMPRRAPIHQLRAAVDRLPLRTKEAMLHGVRTNEIIVGAYADRGGGVCPMLAAHRNGGRTSFIGFAQAWDRFSGARRARRATRREVRILEAQLEASILAERDAGLLGATIAEHQSLVRGRKAREAALTGLYAASSGGSPTRSTGARASSLGNAPSLAGGGLSR
jgi:hypothetical protein